MKKQPTSDSDVWISELNLKFADKDIIENNQELNDRCMDAVSVLLKRKFTEIKGLQSTLVVGNKDHCEFIGTESDSVQLIHQISRQHWVSCALQDGELYMYDSMQPHESVLPVDTKKVIQNLYGDVKKYVITDVAQQTGSIDCGLYAFAYLTFLCHGFDPSDYRLSQRVMRKHPITWLENKEITIFPSTKKRQKQPLKRVTLN